MRSSPSGLLLPLALASTVSSTYLTLRDGMEHGHAHGAPLLEINETEILEHHAPTPPSYFAHDWQAVDAGSPHPGLMITHSVLMSTAFLIILPVAIAMRSARSPWHSLFVALFYVFTTLACASAALYKKLTPDMYPGSKHGVQGHIFLALAVSLTVVDVYNLIARVVRYVRGGERFALKSFWKHAILGKEEHPASEEELELYTGLTTEDPEELTDVKLHSPTRPQHEGGESNRNDSTAQWANHVHRHRHHFSGLHRTSLSTYSDETLGDADSHAHRRTPQPPQPPFLRRAGSIIFAVLERSLVLAGFAGLLSGIAVYTGGCRGNYINGCLAHLIKGSIFWAYGLLTFARFLGSFSEYGWSWNRAPQKPRFSAEFVESFVIFLYGITNTWMERFGAHPGDPYTAKQIQHISIAVMFWFAGLLGMALESVKVREWLSSSIMTFNNARALSRGPITEPPSYMASFNPFPAMVIGITGAAMAAHSQTYMFQVRIHELWGGLLVAFSVMRCLTYFFLWLGPPTSLLPSRPPTEALGSFFLAGGGLMFMFSTEEVTLTAMRHGFDDTMMFVNVVVAITCLALCWTISIVGFKGWLKRQAGLRVSSHSAA